MSFERLLSKYPCLYNKNDMNFRDRSIRNKCKTQLLKECNLHSSVILTTADLDRKIRNYRQTLRRKQKKILVAPAPVDAAAATTSASIPTTTIADDSPDEAPPPRILRRPAAERKYGKRQRADDADDAKDSEDGASVVSKKSTTSNNEGEVSEWDACSIEEEERSVTEMFQHEMSVKRESDDLDIDEDSLVYSPLACELCAEVFTLPAAWVRHVQAHARTDAPHARKRKHRSAGDDTKESTALLRCDLCQKYFLKPAEWVRHIQSTHTESALGLDPPPEL